MKDSVILATALVTGVVGVIVLYFLSSNIEIQTSGISQVKQLEENSEVRLKGEVVSITSMANLTIITIMRPEAIEVVVFQKINLSEGEFIDVIGKIGEFRGEKQVIADKLVIDTKG